MAKGRVFKQKIVDSRKWRSLYTTDPIHPHSLYPILTASVDPWGMLPADPLRLKSKLGPLDESHTDQEYADAVWILHAVGLIHIWEHQGIPWLYVVGHDEEQTLAVRSRKSDPEVPRPTLTEINQLSTKRYTSLRQVLGESKTSLRQLLDKSKGIRDARGSDRGSRSGMEDVLRPPPPQKSENENPIARPGQPSTGTPSPLEGAGKGNSSEAVHGGQRPSTSSQVFPPLAGQPPQSDGRGNSPSPTSASSGGTGSASASGAAPSSNETPGAHRSIDPGPKPIPGPGGGRVLPTIGDVLGGEAWRSQVGSAQVPTKADSWELVAIQELQQVFADTWGREISPVLPRGDNLTRILEVLRHPAGGVDCCKAAIRGHHKIASKDGSQHGRDFRHVFPPLRAGGQQQTARVDLDRVFEYAAKGKPPRPRREEKPKKPEISREESKAMAKKGLAQVRETLKKIPDKEVTDGTKTKHSS